MKKFIVLAAVFVLVSMSCEDGKGDNADDDETGNNNTTLRIKNESFIELNDVVWNNVQFTETGDSIKIGTNTTKDVEAGSGYIYFKKQGNPIAVRTNALVTTDENNANEFVFVNNTVIVEAGNPGNAATLEMFYTRTYKIGDVGPGNGTIFSVEGGRYLECSGDLGDFDWTAAVTATQNYRGGGFSDWYLPNQGELVLIFQNLYIQGLGSFRAVNHWSSSEFGPNAYAVQFADGTQKYWGKPVNVFAVRAVRSFTFQ